MAQELVLYFLLLQHAEYVSHGRSYDSLKDLLPLLGESVEEKRNERGLAVLKHIFVSSNV